MRKGKRVPDSDVGEAGYRGHDRQPVKDHTGQSAGTPEDESLAASPRQVHSASRQAKAMRQGKHSRPDMVHPGPGREEGEKSRGDAHHDQRETEKEMKSEDL